MYNNSMFIRIISNKRISTTIFYQVDAIVTFIHTSTEHIYDAVSATRGIASP
jgi:hypothetical protein